MESLIIGIREALTAQGLAAEYAGWAASGAGVVLLAALAWLVNFIAKHVILRALSAAVASTHFQWDNAMLESGFFTRLSHLAPAMVINAFGPDVLGGTPGVLAAVNTAVNVYLTFIWLAVFFALLDAILLLSERAEHAERMPVKGFVQAMKLIAALAAGILVLAVRSTNPRFISSPASAPSRPCCCWCSAMLFSGSSPAS